MQADPVVARKPAKDGVEHLAARMLDLATWLNVPYLHSQMISRQPGST